MKIELSINELEELYASFRQVLDETRDASYMRWRKECGGQEGPRPSGWVSHPVSTDNPPSVTTVATAGADVDVEKARRLEDDAAHAWVVAQTEPFRRRAEEIGGSVIRRLLDFEAFLDSVTESDDDIERIRFHYTYTLAGNGVSVSVYRVTYYRNADRRRVPREVTDNVRRDIPKDDREVGGLIEEILYDIIGNACEYVGVDPEDYSRWLDTPPSRKGVQATDDEGESSGCSNSDEPCAVEGETASDVGGDEVPPDDSAMKCVGPLRRRLLTLCKYVTLTMKMFCSVGVTVSGLKVRPCFRVEEGDGTIIYCNDFEVTDVETPEDAVIRIYAVVVVCVLNTFGIRLEEYNAWLDRERERREYKTCGNAVRVERIVRQWADFFVERLKGEILRLHPEKYPDGWDYNLTLCAGDGSLRVVLYDRTERKETYNVTYRIDEGDDVGEMVRRVERDFTNSVPEKYGVGMDVAEQLDGDGEAAYVWSIVNGRLSALERWVESKTGKPGISVGVTLSGDTVTVRIAEQSDKDCGPVKVMETKVGKGRDKYSCAERILSEAYKVVFGKFVDLSYSEFIESISVASDGR